MTKTGSGGGSGATPWVLVTAIALAAAGYREGRLRVGTVQTLCLLGLAVWGHLLAVHRLALAALARTARCDGATLEELAGSLLAGPRHAGLDEAGFAALQDLEAGQVCSMVWPAQVVALDRLFELRREVRSSLAGHCRFAPPRGSGFWLDLDARSGCGRWHDVVHLALEDTAWVLTFSGPRPAEPFPRPRLEEILGSCRLAGPGEDRLSRQSP
jgi:hypothetical protein